MATDTETCPRLKRDGSPCPNPRMRGEEGARLDYCFAHRPDIKSVTSEATKASADKRKARAEARESQVEEAKIAARLGIDHWIAVEADKHDEELAKALVQRAIENPDGRAMTMLLERRLGKVADKLEVNGEPNPLDMDAATLARWLAQPDAEEPVLED